MEKHRAPQSHEEQHPQADGNQPRAHVHGLVSCPLVVHPDQLCVLRNEPVRDALIGEHLVVVLGPGEVLWHRVGGHEAADAVVGAGGHEDEAVDHDDLRPTDLEHSGQQWLDGRKNEQRRQGQTWRCAEAVENAGRVIADAQNSNHEGDAQRPQPYGREARLRRVRGLRLLSVALHSRVHSGQARRPGLTIPPGSSPEWPRLLRPQRSSPSMTLSPPRSRLRPAAVMNSMISSVSSGSTGGTPVRKNFTISTSIGA